MSRYHDDDPNSPNRILARSLLDEAAEEYAIQIGDLQARPRDRHRAPARKRADGAPYIWSRDSIATALRTFYAQTHRLPATQEWKEPQNANLPARGTILRWYGSLHAAYATAGLPGYETHGDTILARSSL